MNINTCIYKMTVMTHVFHMSSEVSPVSHPDTVFDQLDTSSIV